MGQAVGPLDGSVGRPSRPSSTQTFTCGGDCGRAIQFPHMTGSRFRTIACANLSLSWFLYILIDLIDLQKYPSVRRLAVGFPLIIREGWGLGVAVCSRSDVWQPDLEQSLEREGPGEGAHRPPPLGEYTNLFSNYITSQQRPLSCDRLILPHVN